MPALPALPEPVARELERHKFPNAEAKEAMAAQLLAVWKAMQPKSSDAYVMLERQRHRRAHGRR
jgi:hypothetical protein